LSFPLIGFAFVITLILLRVRTPPGDVKEKLKRLDVFGNLIFISGTTAALIGVTWAGVRYPWDSAHVLGTIIPGFILIAVFFAYEWIVPKEASIPWQVVNNRTTVAGLLGTFFHGITSLSVFYYMPVYFQACHGASPLRSSVMFLPLALTMSPFAFTAGGLVHVFKKYRWAILLAWSLSLVGFGLLSTLTADISTGHWVGYQIVVGVGTGLLFTATVFPLLAPLPVSRTAAALAFFSFCRTFAQAWGIAIGSTVLQNELARTLPAGFAARFPTGADIAYAAIPALRALPDPTLRAVVEAAFAQSLRVLWLTMVGVSGLGWLSVWMMREIKMEVKTDATYGLNEGKRRRRDVEKAAPGAEATDVQI
ncbi:major facilitator superfamily domain-containing protein, partial [Epithele typhae]|uniref:major facilitator superfamily domain-containing protein n=1 Tax=Epithele typhae TaxID=378194 RepID=UPI0020081AFE